MKICKKCNEPISYNSWFGAYYCAKCGELINEDAKDIDTDPIHAAGGCYCRECEYQNTDSCVSWYEENLTYRDRWGINQETGFCSEGQRKENN